MLKIIIIAAYMAFAPAIFWVWFYFRKKKSRDYQPKKIWFKLFFGGMLATIPAALIESLAKDHVFPVQLQLCLANGCDVSIPRNALWILLYFVGVVALSEEFFKFIFLKGAAYRYPLFTKIKDGLEYGVAVGLGFATLENIIYFVYPMLAGDYSGLAVDFIIRFFMATLAHTVYTGLIGYFMAKSRFAAVGRGWILFAGVLLAVLIHGLYDFFIPLQLSIYAELIIGGGLLILILINRNPANSVSLVQAPKEAPRYDEDEEMKDANETSTKQYKQIIDGSRSDMIEEVSELMKRKKL